MAVNKKTLRELKAMRVEVDRIVDSAAADITVAWATAWNEIVGEWVALIDDLIARAAAGKPITRADLTKAARYRSLLAHTRDRLAQAAKASAARVVEAVPSLLDATVAAHERIVGSQLPKAHGIVWDRPDTDALDAIVRRSTQRITVLHRPLSAEADRAMRASLIRGVAVGDNPRRAAADMLNRVQGDFNGGRNRALVIARTEMLDAHRTAAQAADKAASDVVTQWQWVAQLDKRTCPACWAMHGSKHPVDEQGPLDHQQGRCARAPITRTWRDLGFDVDEPESLIRSGPDVFDSLPETDQAAILGKARLRLLRSGDVTWDDLVTRRSTDGWRDSMVPTPLNRLAG